MERIVAHYPTIKLSSLPQFLASATSLSAAENDQASHRIIELSIRGDPAAVPLAMREMQQEIHNLGFRFSTK